MKITAFAMLSSLAVAGSVFAGPVVMEPQVAPTQVVPSSIYRDQELFFDIYGSYLDRSSNNNCGCTDDNKKNGFGGGFAIGDYINPYIGARFDVNFSSVHDARTDIGADFLFRLPI